MQRFGLLRFRCICGRAMGEEQVNGTIDGMASSALDEEGLHTCIEASLNVAALGCMIFFLYPLTYLEIKRVYDMSRQILSIRALNHARV